MTSQRKEWRVKPDLGQVSESFFAQFPTLVFLHMFIHLSSFFALAALAVVDFGTEAHTLLALLFTL